jgi:16S rRNA (cytosine1402-N4)-methyltransferase
MNTKHKPVLLQETIIAMDIVPKGIYVDVTLGGAGHSEYIRQKQSDQGVLVCFDLDSKAIDRYKEKLLKIGYEYNAKQNCWEYKSHKVFLINSNFKDIQEQCDAIGIKNIDGIIADLGLSSDQLDDDLEGFSFLRSNELDMRLDKSQNIMAKDILNALYEKELIRIFEEYADIDFAKPLAKEIIRTRNENLIQTTKQLKNIVQKVVPFYKRRGGNKHPDAKVFQALRIAVNDEYHNLQFFLPRAFEILKPQGKLAVITFHSGEDRILKNFCKEQIKQNKAIYELEILQPDHREISSNPRSRSAKLRVLKKI